MAEMNGCHWTSKKKAGHELRDAESVQEQVMAYFPQVEFLEELLRAYPQAHFILNVREKDVPLALLDQLQHASTDSTRLFLACRGPFSRRGCAPSTRTTTCASAL